MPASEATDMESMDTDTDVQDSEKLLRPVFKAAHAKLVANFLAPKSEGGRNMTLAQVMASYKEYGAINCSQMYLDAGLELHEVSAEYYHLIVFACFLGSHLTKAQLVELVSMSVRSLHKLVSEKNTPRSPEYAAFFAEAEKNEELKRRRELSKKMDHLVSKYPEKHDIADLAQQVWATVDGSEEGEMDSLKWARHYKRQRKSLE